MRYTSDILAEMRSKSRRLCPLKTTPDSTSRSVQSESMSSWADIIAKQAVAVPEDPLELDPGAPVGGRELVSDPVYGRPAPLG